MLLMVVIDDEQNIIAAIYKKNYKRMLYVSSQILGSARGEEAVHDVFVKLIEKNYDDFSKLRDKPALFFVIVMKNHAKNLLKKDQGGDLPLDEEQMFYSELDPEELSIAKDSEEALFKLIGTLNPTDREILEYKYVVGYTNKEIAQRLETTQTVVSSRIDRAKKALKKRLEERGVCEAHE